MQPQQLNGLENLDKYNIFDLLGLFSIEDEKKKQLLLSINEAVWSEFLFNRLDKILPEKDLLEVKSMVGRSEEVGKILGYIELRAPTLYQLILEHTRQVKLDLIKEHLETDIEEIKIALNITEDEGKREKLSQKVQKYQTAKNYLENYDFENLKNLMSQ